MTNANSSTDTKTYQNLTEEKKSEKNFSCQVSVVRCHVSGVRCQMSRVMCQLSHINNANSHSHTLPLLYPLYAEQDELADLDIDSSTISGQD